VKPERDHNNRKSIRELWWRFGWERPLVRKALMGLDRYIGTTESPKHRVFQFIPGGVLSDHMVICFAMSDAFFLGVLSSRIHFVWTTANAGSLGGYLGNIRYNKNRCFDPFPFPACTEVQTGKIRDLAQKVDNLRKCRQAAHPDLTLTGMYNVLEKLRVGEALTVKEKTIHEHGLVSVLRELHDELDATVFDAYGWSDLAESLVGKPGATMPLPDMPAEVAEGEEELLSRLVALNSARAAEEQRGLIRWLRPEFQIPASGQPQTRAAEQLEIDTGEEVAVAAKPGERRPWPATLPAQVKAVAEVLTAARVPLADDAIAACFTGRGAWKKRLPQIIDTLVAVGRARRGKDGLAVIA
jgi:hypothetical protein